MADPVASDRGVYSIAVAAELAGLGEQTLRLYESKGLLAPARTPGGTRRYSDDDVVILHRVVELLAEGLNLTGARRVLELETINAQLHAQIAQLKTTTATRGADHRPSNSRRRYFGA